MIYSLWLAGAGGASQSSFSFFIESAPRDEQGTFSFDEIKDNKVLRKVGFGEITAAADGALLLQLRIELLRKHNVFGDGPLRQGTEKLEAVVAEVLSLEETRDQPYGDVVAKNRQWFNPVNSFQNRFTQRRKERKEEKEKEGNHNSIWTRRRCIQGFQSSLRSLRLCVKSW